MTRLASSPMCTPALRCPVLFAVNCHSSERFVVEQRQERAIVGVVFSCAEKLGRTIKVDTIKIKLVIRNDINIKLMLFSIYLVKRI
jgi:hypothetical protein